MACAYHVEVPGAEGRAHLCERHWKAWRDGPREGPAVVDRVARCRHGCAACAAEKSKD